MDTKKIGAFLKQCRKEKNLTQEQLAEKFGVSARTVSRWETGSNMPDLSILVELADYYEVEIKELLIGERSLVMNKEMKATLNQVADYENWVKQKAWRAGSLAFFCMFLMSACAIVLQLLWRTDLFLVLGESVMALAGGSIYLFIMVRNGIWEKSLSEKGTIGRDLLISILCAGIFSVFYGISLRRMGAAEEQAIRLALLFWGGITVAGFAVLRILSYVSRKRRRLLSREREEREQHREEIRRICNAKDALEAEMLIGQLKENGITAFSQEAGAGVAMHDMSGFGLYGMDILVRSDEAEKAWKIIQEVRNSKK